MGIPVRDYKAGDKIAELTLENSFCRDKRKYWNCRCSCGNLVERRQSYLSQIERNNHLASCGCKHGAKLIGSKNTHWKGCGSLSGYKFSQLKHGAIRRDIKFEVTIEQIWQKYQDQNGLCALTGLPISINEYTKTKRNKSTASLDRKDPDGDYTLDNIQWVHKDINLIKNHFSEKTLFEYCKLIVQHNNLLV